MRATVRQSVWIGLDQVVSSLGNIALVVWVARNSAFEAGQVAVGMSIVVICSAVARGFDADWRLVDAISNVHRGSMAPSLVVFLSTLCLLALVSFTAGAQLLVILIACCCAIPVALIEVFRIRLQLVGRSSVGVYAQVSWLLCLVAGLVMMGTEASGALALGVWGIAAIPSSLMYVGLALKSQLGVPIYGEFPSIRRRLSFAFDSGIQSGSTQLLMPLLLILGGPSTAGVARLALSMLGPVNITFTALWRVRLPTLSQQLAMGGSASLYRATGSLAVALLAVAFGFAGALRLVPVRIGTQLMGPIWLDIARSWLWLAAFGAVGAVTAVCWILLRIRRRDGLVLVSRFGALLLRLIFTGISVRYWADGDAVASLGFGAGAALAPWVLAVALSEYSGRGEPDAATLRSP